MLIWNQIRVVHDNENPASNLETGLRIQANRSSVYALMPRLETVSHG